MATALTTKNLQRLSAYPRDLDSITAYAAVGDSFSSGIKAGNKQGSWGDWFCSRYDASFPAQINVDPRLGDSSKRDFKYWACSGARVKQVLDDQINKLPDASQDLITITAGGNDLGFSNILNECIFQWLSDSVPIHSQCPGQLQKAQDVIDSDDFHKQLDDLIQAAKKKLRFGGNVYYIGYAGFFGEEDNQCDQVTWSYLYEFGKREYLTLDKRKQMNGLVRNLNTAISDAVKRNGPHVTFVDWDHYPAVAKGRFCEDGFPETNPNRYGLLYYGWDTDDSKDPTNRQALQQDPKTFQVTPDLFMNGTFEAEVNDLFRRGQANQTLLPGVQITGQDQKPPDIKDVNATDDQIARGYSSSILPDSYTRVFHPRPDGHRLIADLVIYHIQADNAAAENKPWPPEEIHDLKCPAINQVTIPGPRPNPFPLPKTSAPAPAPSNPPKDTCGTWYKFWFDDFEIYGKDFDSSKFANGDGLKKQIEGCGDLTKWTFDGNLKNDPQGYTWKATGRLPMGTKNCVGDAVISAGGGSKDGCSGAG